MLEKCGRPDLNVFHLPQDFDCHGCQTFILVQLSIDKKVP